MLLQDMFGSVHSYPSFFRSLQVATKIKANLRETAGHEGYDHLNEQVAAACVPDSVNMLVK